MDGVVFDFDGVLADSMRLHAEAYRRALAPLGVAVDDAEVFRREGARSETIIQDLCQGQTVDAVRLADDKQRIFRSLGAVRLYPGVQELLARVQEQTATALVTGTRRSNLEQIIPDLLERFQAVLSQESYTHDKPHPEPYARAADALGMAPERLICVENAVRGIQSARAAGYGHIIAIATTMPVADLPADEVVADHEELLASLTRWGVA